MIIVVGTGDFAVLGGFLGGRPAASRGLVRMHPSSVATRT